MVSSVPMRLWEIALGFEVDGKKAWWRELLAVEESRLCGSLILFLVSFLRDWQSQSEEAVLILYLETKRTLGSGANTGSADF